MSPTLLNGAFSSQMATVLNHSESEAIALARIYLEKNKSCLAKTIRESITTDEQVTHANLVTACKYLEGKGISVSEELSTWCLLHIGSKLLITPPIPSPKAEPLSEDETEQPSQPEAEKPKSKRGRPKGAKNKSKTPEGPIEPVILSDWQELEIKDVLTDYDSPLLADLVPLMGRYVETPTSHFKAKAVHLTLKGHYNYVELLNYYHRRMPEKIEITAYSLVREVGVKRGYQHTHALLIFNTKIEVRASFFDYNVGDVHVHPNIRSKHHKTALDAVVAYHYKDGDFPHTNIRIKCDSLGAQKMAELLALCPSVTEAIQRFCKPDLSNVRDITTAYEALSVTETPGVALRSLRIWQQEVMLTLRRNIHPRQILFIVDFPGKGGKSKFADHIASQMTTMIIRLAKTRDAAHVLAKYYGAAKNKDIKCIVFDFTRSVGDISDIFDFLEQVRDGRISSGKYISSTISFPTPPQVVILTNKSIDVSLLTIDRYRMWYLLVDHESPVSFGKGLLKQYAGPDGFIPPEGNARFTIDIQNVISDLNNEFKRRMEEAGLYSDSSIDEDGPITINTIKSRGIAVVDASITRREIKRSKPSSETIPEISDVTIQTTEGQIITPPDPKYPPLC